MPKIYTADAARILGVSIRKIHRLVASGELVAEMKLPGTTGAYVFDEDAVRSLATKTGAVS